MGVVKNIIKPIDMNTNLFNIKLPNGQTLQQVANTMKQTVQKTVQKTVQTCKTCGSR